MASRNAQHLQKCGVKNPSRDPRESLARDVFSGLGCLRDWGDFGAASRDTMCRRRNVLSHEKNQMSSEDNNAWGGLTKTTTMVPSTRA